MILQNWSTLKQNKNAAIKNTDNEDAVTVEFDSSRSVTSSLNNVTIKIQTDSESSSVGKLENCFAQPETPVFDLEPDSGNASHIVYSRVNHGYVDDPSEDESPQISPYMTKDAAMWLTVL